MRARRRLSRPWLPAPGFADLRLLSGNGHAVATDTLADLAPVPERTKGTACKAVKPRVQIPPGAQYSLPFFGGVVFGFWLERAVSALLGSCRARAVPVGAVSARLISDARVGVWCERAR